MFPFSLEIRVEKKIFAPPAINIRKNKVNSCFEAA